MAFSGKSQPPGVHKIKAFDAQSDPIAIALRRLHDEVQAEAIPTEFLDLLAAIDIKMGSKVKNK